MKSISHLTFLIAGLLSLWTSAAAWGAGHGPIFALSTPTLGKGQWSSDTAGMAIGTGQGTAFMSREWLGYGLTDDVELTLGVPLTPDVDELKLDRPPRTRGMAMMGGFDTVEPGLLWRFDKHYPGGGQRYESTFMFNAGIPTAHERGSIKVGPSFNAAVTTGYASRTWYWWVGAGYEHYFQRDHDRLGDLPYLTAAVGYRPLMFQHDYPKPDVRFFLESVAEFPQRNQLGGATMPDSGGTRWMLGPSVLGLFGQTGVSAGILLPVYQNLHGDQPKETFRAAVDFVIWF